MPSSRKERGGLRSDAAEFGDVEARADVRRSPAIAAVQLVERGVRSRRRRRRDAVRGRRVRTTAPRIGSSSSGPPALEILQHRRLDVVEPRRVLDACVDVDVAERRPSPARRAAPRSSDARTSARALAIGEHRLDRHPSQYAHRIEPDVVDELQPDRLADVRIGFGGQTGASKELHERLRRASGGAAIGIAEDVAQTAALPDASRRDDRRPRRARPRR